MQRNFFKVTKKNEETKFDEVNEELFLPKCFLMFFILVCRAEVTFKKLLQTEYRTKV